MLFSSTLLADCDPDPLTVATIRNAFALFLTQGKVSSRHLAGFPSNNL
jgi:hypothetical protein